MLIRSYAISNNMWGLHFVWSKDLIKKLVFDAYSLGPEQLMENTENLVTPYFLRSDNFSFG